MWTRILMASAIAGLLGLSVSPQAAHADGYVETTGSYTEGAPIRGNRYDTGGNLKVNSAAAGTATAAAPSLSEGAAGSWSFDLSGNARVTLGTLISGEDQTNNLLMTSGGVVRQTQLVGTGGVPTTATDATTSAQILPTLKKTFHGIVTCTGTCVQTQKIYGAYESSATVASSVLVCTLTMNASTTAVDYCVTDVNFSYWFVVTSATSGTTPLAALLVQY